MYVYVYMYVYIYVYMYVYLYVYTYACTFVHAYVYTPTPTPTGDLFGKMSWVSQLKAPTFVLRQYSTYVKQALKYILGLNGLCLHFVNI
jgi:hypothetical protein